MALRGGKVIVEKEKLVDAISDAINNSKPRKFVETVEMAVNLRNVDLKRLIPGIFLLKISIPHNKV